MQVWSNGDVTINSGGAGETLATKIILNIVLRVFKLEVKDNSIKYLISKIYPAYRCLLSTRYSIPGMYTIPGICVPSYLPLRPKRQDSLGVFTLSVITSLSLCLGVECFPFPPSRSSFFAASSLFPAHTAQPIAHAILLK